MAQRDMAWETDVAGGYHAITPWSGEPVEVLLGHLLGGSRTARQRAAKLLHEAGSLRTLGRIAGQSPLLTPAERDRLLAGLELGRRALIERVPKQRLGGPEAIVARYRDLALAEVEILVVAGLDCAGRVRIEQRFVGTVDGVHLVPRDVLRLVIAAGAVALILVHNHPSGEPIPSAADLAFTQRVQRAAAVCGVQVLDHVVLAAGGWVSLRALGHLDALRLDGQP